jgi:hypothetical protein
MMCYTVVHVFYSQEEKLCITESHVPTEGALIAQLGERQTEDLKVLCSIHSQSIPFGNKYFHFI